MSSLSTNQTHLRSCLKSSHNFAHIWNKCHSFYGGPYIPRTCQIPQPYLPPLSCSFVQCPLSGHNTLVPFPLFLKHAEFIPTRGKFQLLYLLAGSWFPDHLPHFTLLKFLIKFHLPEKLSPPHPQHSGSLPFASRQSFYPTYFLLLYVNNF